MDSGQLEYPENRAMELSDFKAMDYFAVNDYNLPVELMMENAGLQLANLVARSAEKSQIILIGIGNGNNGGGGLVAARRLLSFGAQTSTPTRYDVWVDAYLGFSQRLPLTAPKKLLYQLPDQTEIFIADLGIPAAVYQKFNMDPFPSLSIQTTYFN